MPSIINKEYEKSYHSNGFFIIKSFVEKDIVNKLKLQLLSKQVSKVGFYTSTCIDDSSYREFCNSIINTTIQQKSIATVLEGYKVFYSNFINKTPNSDSKVVLHTDWSITDETIYNPFKIWIPLVDVNKENGTFAAVIGSHIMSNKHRGYGSSEYYTSFTENLINNYIHYFELEAGDALFYHPGMLHYSPPNNTNLNRPAILISLHAENVQPLLYYRNWYNLFGTMSVYAFEESYMNIWDKVSTPKLKRIGNVKEKINKLDEKSYLQNCKIK